MNLIRRRSGAMPGTAARLVATVLALGAAVALVVGTIGPPLFGRGVFLTSDLIYIGFPWHAEAEPFADLNAGHGGPTTDTVDVVYPSREVFGRGVRHGDFLPWNPYNFGGEPLGATSNFGQLNPLAWPFIFTPGWLAPAMVKLAGLASALLFTYLFCRRLGTDRVPAILGAVVYAGSGFIVMWNNWPQADVASLLPALFWATERFLQKRTASSAVPIAVALACALLAMFPAVVGYALTVLVGYVIFRLVAGLDWRPSMPPLAPVSGLWGRRPWAAAPEHAARPADPASVPLAGTPPPGAEPAADVPPEPPWMSRDPSGDGRSVESVESVRVIAPEGAAPPAAPSPGVPPAPVLAPPAAPDTTDGPDAPDVPPAPDTTAAPEAAPTDAATGRLSVRQTLVAGVGTVLGLVAGVALVAAILIPFGARLSSSALDRGQNSDSILGVPALITTVAPDALGISYKGVNFAGPRNQVEGVAYIGVVALVLAIASLALPRIRRGQPGAVAGLTVTTALLGLATFGGGPLLAFLQNFPPYDMNYIGRARSILALTVSALAAVGLQALLERGVAERARRLGVAGVARLVVVVGLAAWFASWVYGRSHDEALAVDRIESFTKAMGSVQVFGWLALVGVALLLIGRGPARQLLAAGLVIVAVVQGLTFAVPLLPNENEDTLYPDTPGLAFLREHVGDQRVVPEGYTLFANATMLEGIRSVTGHGFHAPTWKDMLSAASPGAFAKSPTLAQLSGDPLDVSSPIFDRMGARWFVGTPLNDPFGTRQTLTLDRADCAVPSNPEAITAPPDISFGLWSTSHVFGGRVSEGTVIGRLRVPAENGLHGVVVRLCDTVIIPRDSTFVVTAESGGVTETGKLPVHGGYTMRDFALPVPAGTMGGGGPIDVTISIRSSEPVDVHVAGGPGGGISADVIRPQDDGLRLVYANDLRIYERTRALPRIRWANRSVVIPKASERVRYLGTQALPADTVVFGSGQPGGSGQGGQVQVLRDDHTIRVAVDAEGDGWAVIADSLQTDWVASVDGKPADLVDADHSGVAVAVPAGHHVVEVRYHPRGQAAGIRISVGTALVLAIAAAVSLARQFLRHRGRQEPEPEQAAMPEPDPGVPPVRRTLAPWATPPPNPPSTSQPANAPPATEADDGDRPSAPRSGPTVAREPAGSSSQAESHGGVPDAPAPPPSADDVAPPPVHPPAPAHRTAGSNGAGAT